MMRWADWFFRDRATGRIVVGQFPNWSLWGFVLARVAAALTSGEPNRWAWIASEAFLVVWALDELFRGVNPWRRCLGGAVLLWLAVSGFAARPFGGG